MRQEHKDPDGGLTPEGRRYFKKKEGANLKPPVKNTPKAGSKRFSRKVSFAARFGGMAGPERDEKGRPTRLLKALQAWGFRSKASARNFARRHKKS